MKGKGRLARVPLILGSLLLSSLSVATANGAPNDIVINHVTVVDVVKGEVVPDREIIIRSGEIVSIEPQSSSEANGTTVIDGTSLIAIPGFINTHTHLWQHLAKGFFPSGNLQEWIRIYRFAHYLERDELHQTTLAAASEGLLSGVTTVADFASVNFSDFALAATCDALNEATMGGALVYWNPPAFLPHRVKLQELRALRERCGKVSVWMGHGPLSFYPVPAVFDAIHTAKALDMNLSEHTMENVQEQRDFHRRLKEYMELHGEALKPEIRGVLQRALDRGKPSAVDGVEWLRRLARDMLKYDEGRERLSAQEREELARWEVPDTISPVPLLERFGAFDKRYISIHSVWQSQSDMDIYKRRGVAVSHNPESNLYLSSGIAPILQYQENGINVSLATDGAASNDGINFFSAMRAAWNLQKIATLDTEVSKAIDAWYVLRAATINGALAMGIDERTGSLEPGKEADIVLLSRERLKIAPYVPGKNEAPLMIYSGSPIAVDAVISDGKLVAKGGELVGGRSVAELARGLSETSNAVYARYETGKVWREELVVDGATIDAPWYRYRSVREKDEIDVRLTNDGERPLELYVAMSGNVFGGVESAMLSAESKAVLPHDPSPKFWERRVTLKPGASAYVRKEKGDYRYTITTPDGLFKRDGRAEQLLFLVEQ